MAERGEVAGASGLPHNISEVQLASIPGAYPIEMYSGANDEGITGQEYKDIGTSGTPQELSDIQLSSTSGAFPIDMPSVDPSIPVEEAGFLLPKSVYRARGMVATEGQVTESSYVSFRDIETRQRSLSGFYQDDFQVNEFLLTGAPGLEVRLPSPMPMQSLPTRTPKFRIHFIRHGQATHNIRNLLKAYEIHNPPLTQLGHLQCETVLKTFPHMDKITHVLCSPLTRTLQTALECFKPVFDRGVKLVAWNQLIECGTGASNTGDPLPELKKKTEGLPVDLSHLSNGWELTPNNFADGRARARGVAKKLHSICQVGSRSGENASDRLDMEILVVSHGVFLRHLLREHPKFANCQVRSCEFASDDQIRQGASEFDLFETNESKAISYELDWSSLEKSLEEGIDGGLEELMEGLSLTEESA